VKIKVKRRIVRGGHGGRGKRTIVPEVITQIPATELAAVCAQLEQQVWLTDPDAFVTERCGEHLWSKQKLVAQSLVDHRKTAVPSCHGSGKSFEAARLTAWWLTTHKAGEAFVVTTAPTGRQVKAILWREIGRVQAKAALPGRTNQTEWFLTTDSGNEEIVAFGMKPDDMSPTAFQGIHARFVLVILDEAYGVAEALWDAADTLLTNDKCRFLAIGNPDDPDCAFGRACKPGSGFNVIPISAFDTPNFTGEPIPEEIADVLVGYLWVEDKRKKWAPTWTWDTHHRRCSPPPDGKLEDTHPFWQSKVLGQFPVQSSVGSLIPLTWIRAAQQRTLPPIGPNELGLDVGASEGGDPSCLGHRIGPVFRIMYEERQPDTMLTLGHMLQFLNNKSIGASLAKVDYIGVGRGVVDRAREQGLPVHPIQVSEASTVRHCLNCHHEWDTNLLDVERCPECNSDNTQKAFPNLLSQCWWQIRTMFQDGEIDLDEQDEDLAAELMTLRWEPNSKGQTTVKYGDGPSPNRADSLLIAYAPLPQDSIQEFVSW
jgi:hypothetical protein